MRVAQLEAERHIGYIFTAELQVRLASAVRIATTLKEQPLDLPVQSSHGSHLLTYEEVALRPDQADCAASFLQHCATFLMAVTMKDTIRAGATGSKVIWRFAGSVGVSNCAPHSQCIRSCSLCPNLVDRPSRYAKWSPLRSGGHFVDGTPKLSAVARLHGRLATKRTGSQTAFHWCANTAHPSTCDAAKC